jgi:hypothetical protein
MRSRRELIESTFLICLLAALACYGIWSVWPESLPEPPTSLPSRDTSKPSRLTWEEQEERARQEDDRRGLEEAKLLTARIDKETERGPIRCIVRWAGGDPEKVELSLMNDGHRPRRFWHTIFGLKEHVTMVLRDYRGEVVAHLRWAPLSSSVMMKEFIVPPGKGQMDMVYLRILAPAQPRPKLEPGRYWFQAIFEFDSPGEGGEQAERMFSRSERIPVVVDGSGVRAVAE